MAISPDHWQRVIDAIQAQRLRLEPPATMFAGRGTGRTCDGCGEKIDAVEVEYECVYQDGISHALHLACAGVLDMEQRRVVTLRSRAQNATDVREHARSMRQRSKGMRDEAGHGEGERSPSPGSGPPGA